MTTGEALFIHANSTQIYRSICLFVCRFQLFYFSWVNLWHSSQSPNELKRAPTEGSTASLTPRSRFCSCGLQREATAFNCNSWFWPERPWEIPKWPYKYIFKLSSKLIIFSTRDAESRSDGTAQGQEKQLESEHTYAHTHTASLRPFAGSEALVLNLLLQNSVLIQIGSNKHSPGNPAAPGFKNGKSQHTVCAGTNEKKTCSPPGETDRNTERTPGPQGLWCHFLCLGSFYKNIKY